MTTTKNNEHKKHNVPNKQEQNQTCLDSAEREGLRPKGNVPNLRFPEFQGEWHSFLINEICSEFKRGKNIKADSISENGEYPVFGGNGLRGYTASYNHEGLYVLIGRQGALCGNVRSVNGKTYITEHAIAAAGNEKSDTSFLHYLFIKMNLGQYSDQSAQPGLAVNKLLKLEVSLPPISEQKKIAKILSLLDERISTQNKIIEDLKKLKCAIIDEVFCSPKQREPNRRFEGCSEPLSTYKMKDFCFRITDKNKDNKCSLVLTIAAQYGLVDQESFFNKSVASENLTGYYILNKGDFAYNRSYSSGYAWGAVKRLDNYSEGVLSTLYICFRADESIVNSDYLSYYFESSKWHKEVSDISGEGARNHGLLNISVSDYFNTEHRFATMSEQKRIASMLNAIVIKEQNAIELGKLYSKQKQYLLRQMFI